MNIDLNPRALLTLSLLSAALACHAAAPTDDPDPTGADEPGAELEVIPAALPGVALERGLHRARITEVMLDPGASAALTLDRSGGVRLWTSLDGTSEPLALPLDDPRDLSLGVREDGSYVIAQIDTVGGAEVMEVRFHDGEARLTSLFSIPPMDPLFELHVLDGGERLLALGVDHRVRLYDRDGVELSSIAEHGFVPWQLRHVETDEGVKLVAVLAGPTRVQPLQLVGDELGIVGEARSVELGRGPNRNDLALTADGRRVAVLNRPKRRSARWTLELIDLADGSATMIEGEAGAKLRPRLHLLDGDRALIDDGTGVGQLIDLASVAAADGDEPAPASILRRLPGSDFGSRSHASVERGVRVVPSGDDLIVDHLDADAHLVLGREALGVFSAGVSPDGARVVWGLGKGQGWMIEDLGSTSSAPEPTLSAHDLGSTLLFVDFLDDDHLIVVPSTGPVELRTVEGGEVLASSTPFDALTQARLSRGGAGSTPALIVRDDDRERDVVLGLQDQTFVELDSYEVDANYLAPWHELDGARWHNSTVGHPSWGSNWTRAEALRRQLGEQLDRTSMDVYELATTSDGRRFFSIWSSSAVLVRTRPSSDDAVGEVELERDLGFGIGHVSRIAPSPDGHLLAVVHGSGPRLSIYDAESLERSWTRVDCPAWTLTWTPDGSGLVVARGSEGGAIIDAASGELLLERRDLGFEAKLEDNGAVAPEDEPG